jgi:hypothetical protein
MRGRQPVLSRIGTWLRTTLRKERSADPLWEEDERRRRSGKMGENVVTDEAAPPGDGVTRKVQD